MWHHLLGELVHYAGTSGTVTVGAGECLLLIQTHASSNGATLSILGSPAIPIINGAAPTTIQMYHTLLQVDGSGASTQVVFTSTDSYYIQTVKQRHA